MTRHDLGPLLAGAWARREVLRLTDAPCVELAEQRSCPLLTAATAWRADGLTPVSSPSEPTALGAATTPMDLSDAGV